MNYTKLILLGILMLLTSRKPSLNNRAGKSKSPASIGRSSRLPAEGEALQ